jgi:hypothetical protein
VPDTERYRKQTQCKRKECAMAGEDMPGFEQREATRDQHHNSANAIH